MNGALRVGLTGGIGSGKSTVKGYFDDLHVPTIDADDISHQASRPGHPVFDDIVGLFGEHILDESGHLKRREIRELVFTDPGLRRQLEAIIHPRIRKAIQAFIDKVNYPYCIICIPLLLETNARKTIDRVLVIDIPETLQIARASQRDGTNEDDIRHILRAQINRKDRIDAADDIITNNEGFSHLKSQVDYLHNKYLGMIESG